MMKYELKTQMNFLKNVSLAGGEATGDSTVSEVVLAERPVREMQAQLRLHFRTQDPQGW